MKNEIFSVLLRIMVTNNRNEFKNREGKYGN